MSAFANSNFNKLLVHSALVFIAETAAGAFVFAYLLKTGLPLHFVLLSMTGVTVLRFVLRQMVLATVLRIGLLKNLIIGLMATALSYAVLPQVSGIDGWLALWIFLHAFGAAFYWPCYHAYVTLLGDAEKRGAQMSMKEAINTVAGIIGPAIAALLLTFTTPAIAFSFFAVVLAMSVLPLARAQNIEVQRDAVLDPQKARTGRDFFITDGLIASTYMMTLAGIFITFGSSYLNLGGALTLAGLAGAAASIFIGPMMDNRRARPTLFWVYAAIGLFLAFNSVAYAYVLPALIASVIGAILGPIWYPVMMTPLYNLSKSSECPLRFHIKSEGGWDIGCGAGCAIAAAAVYSGLSLTWPLLLGVVACATGYRIITTRIQNAEPSLRVTA
jgi:MFS transporter, DHA1 family, inner membrane transport protein